MGKNKKGKSSKSGSAASGDGDDWISVDPARVRFQHARIRTHFSGCGRSVIETLNEIREGKLKPADLPLIQVLVGPIADDGERWYFSLNNRRLWVLKRCREEGLLENNQIRVRVRAPKSSSELERYSLQNCALEAKFLRNPESKSKQKVADTEKVVENREPISYDTEAVDIAVDESDDDSDHDVTTDRSNPFNVFL